MSAHPWVCASCRSINQPRETRCYHCRTPRELVEVDPEKLLVAGAGSKLEAAPKPVGQFRSSGDRAFLTQMLIAIALAVTVVASYLGADLVGRALDGDATASLTSAPEIALVGGLGLLLSVAALASWAAWLSRVVANVPAVGLGWTNVTPNAAVFESLIPGVNLYRVPAILRDVTSRLEPNGRGDALIAAAWLALVGGALVPRLGRYASMFLMGSIDELAPMWMVISQLGLGLTVVGGIMLIVLIQWIETRMEARAAAELTPEPATASADAGRQPVPLQTPALAAESPSLRRDDPARAPAAVDAPSTRPRWGGAVARPRSLPASPRTTSPPSWSAQRAAADGWDDDRSELLGGGEERSRA